MTGFQETISEPVPPPYGDDLRIDSEDEDNLNNLPEIERELILSERHDTLQRYKEAKALYDKYVKKTEATLTANTQTAAASTRYGRPSSRRSEKSEEYDSDSYSSSDSSSDSDSSYSSRSRSDDEDRALGGIAKASTEKHIAESLEARLTVDTASAVQATRDLLLASFQDVPTELRDEALMDLFVRIPSGTGDYLICRVVRAIDTSVKTPESGKFDLQVELPGGESTTVPVSSVSNSPITEEELIAWTLQLGEEVAREQARKLHKKQAQVEQVQTFVWDDRTINRILSRKNRSSVKLTLEFAKLRTQLQAELGALNSTTLSDEQRSLVQENIARINKEIAQLEGDYRSTQNAFAEANAHQFGIVAINHRNRTEQRLQDVEEARKRLKSSKEPSKASELNPFKRRECKPVVMWDVGKRSPKKEPKPDPTIDMSGSGLIDTPLAQTRTLLTDLVPLTQLMEAVDKATTQPGSKLRAVRRNMAKQYSEEPARIWSELPTIGEVMDFAEWKRRVQEEDVDMQE